VAVTGRDVVHVFYGGGGSLATLSRDAANDLWVALVLLDDCFKLPLLTDRVCRNIIAGVVVAHESPLSLCCRCLCAVSPSCHRW
jgi:hypothetical protein